MDRIVLVSCAVIIISNFCFEVILASERVDPLLVKKLEEEGNRKYYPVWFSPRLGRRKRNSKDDGYKPTEQDLAELLEAFEESPLALVAVNGNEKLICKNLQGKRSTFTPRLGRNVEDDIPEIVISLETPIVALRTLTMKMPGNQSNDNGLYDYEDNSYFSEGIENNVEEFNAAPETDFSEYLWMENEEEFDKEVMQRLEEEALMEECMEAFMNDETNTGNTNTQQCAPTSTENVANSKLNPEAAEFVPSNRRAPQEIPTSASS
ncbi:hypothetical protein JTB14_013640 [Gonioctena quinquepunctata]|nr:hypothetical protein JTB14_013640 [Gonioctena quinquepunctata]